MRAKRAKHELVLLMSALSYAGSAGSHAADKGPAPAFDKLRSLSGTRYAKAREAFLKLAGAKEFLGVRVKSNSEDWLAYALHQHFVGRGSRRALRTVFYEQLVRRLKDPYGERPQVFDARAFDLPSLDTLMKSTYFLLHPGDAYFKTFDWNAAIALELEYLVRNPNELSDISRLWVFTFGVFSPPPLSHMPLTKGTLSKAARYIPRRRRPHVRVDVEILASWARSLVLDERSPVVRLPAAVNLPGKATAKALEEMAKQDSAVGTVAALLYSARAPWVSPAHPFNAIWLEEWAKKATPKQLEAVEHIFAGNHRPLGVTGYVEQMNERLSIPTSVAGLFLRYHEKQLSGRFKRLFQDAMGDDLKTVTNCLNGYPTRPGQPLRFVVPYLMSHGAWPRRYAAELAKIRTTSRKARAMIRRAIANLMSRTSDYPSGTDLQAAYGRPAPGNKKSQ